MLALLASLGRRLFAALRGEYGALAIGAAVGLSAAAVYVLKTERYPNAGLTAEELHQMIGKAILGPAFAWAFGAVVHGFM